MEIRGKEEGEVQNTRERRRKKTAGRKRSEISPKHESWICH